MKIAITSLLLVGLIFCRNGTTGLQESAAADCTIPFADIGGRCIFIENLLQGTWNDMRYHCQRFGGDLAKIDSADLLGAIVAHLHQYGLTDVHYWIGGTDEENEGDWRWLDGSNLALGTPFWGYLLDSESQRPREDRPDINCALLNAGLFYYFTDYSCDSESANYPFGGICEQQQ